MEQRLNKDIIAVVDKARCKSLFVLDALGARLASVHHLTHRPRSLWQIWSAKCGELRLFRHGSRQAAISSINPWRGGCAVSWNWCNLTTKVTAFARRPHYKRLFVDGDWWGEQRVSRWRGWRGEERGEGRGARICQDCHTRAQIYKTAAVLRPHKVPLVRWAPALSTHRYIHISYTYMHLVYTYTRIYASANIPRRARPRICTSAGL